MAVDFLAKYGIDDKALTSGLKEIEGRAGRHAREVGRKTTSEWDIATKKTSEKFFGFKGVGVAAFSAIGTAAALSGKAVRDYAEKNAMVRWELERLQAASGEVWTSIGRDMAASAIGTELDVWIRKVNELRQSAVDWAAKQLGGDPAAVGEAMKLGEAQTLLERYNAELAKSQNIRRQTLAIEDEEQANFAARKLRESRSAELKPLLTEMDKGGLGREAARLRASIADEANAVKTKQEMDAQEKFNREMDKAFDLSVKRRAARESAVDTLEANAARIFGLEASERQLKIAEVQLSYDKQLRDLAKDKALLEEDRVRAAGLLNEQRDAELSILLAQRGERRTARSLALGSTADPRQAFAPIVNEERNDRKKAQEKFDKMVAELRKIRDNTGKAQVATYQ